LPGWAPKILAYFCCTTYLYLGETTNHDVKNSRRALQGRPSDIDYIVILMVVFLFPSLVRDGTL